MEIKLAGVSITIIQGEVESPSAKIIILGRDKDTGKEIVKCLGANVEILETAWKTTVDVVKIIELDK